MLYLVQKELKKKKNQKKARVYKSFFKTKKGEYGEGDIFYGIPVPELRKIAKKYNDLNFSEIKVLLTSKIHEERFTALLILLDKYKTGNVDQKEKIFKFFLKNIKYVNNWDLVDVSAPKIIGNWLLINKYNKRVNLNDLEFFKKLACSKNLWVRRIAIVSTYEFIKNDEFKQTIAIADILLNDKHDLIHKAVGWMLREVGKRRKPLLKEFIKENIKNIPRTTLRYAIEKFSKKEREEFLNLEYK